ncbi:hypothetical protein BsWGS_24963 [Bradybaena similaris]
MSEDKKNVSLLLVGRDGNGKSSTGNSIFNLGDKKHFNPTSSSSSAGLEIKKASATVGNGREVTVTEIAGLEYPGSDYKGNFKETLKKIEDTIQENTEGFNAIIFVLKYGTRFTKQEKDSLQMIKSIFGVNVLKDFGVIVMTCGDSFELDVEEEEDKQTFEEWCHAQTGDVKTLFEKCAYRCVLFNNRTKDADKMKEQQDKLFSLVELIPHPYTLQKYKDKEAIRGRTEILVQIKLPQLEEHTNQMMDEVWKALNKIDQEFSLPTCNILELSNSLKNIQTKLLDLKKYLQDKDKKTGVLKPLFCAISIAEMRIDTKLKIAEQRLQVATLSGTWVIVSVNGSDFCSQNITETVSIRKCTLDGAGQFCSNSVSGKDVSGCGIVLLEICKTTPESQQVTETSNKLSCGEKLIVVDNNSQTKGEAQEEKFAKAHGYSTLAEVKQAHGIHKQIAQAQSHGTQQGVVQVQSHDTKEGVVQAQSHDTNEGVVPAQSHDTKKGVVPAQSHDTKEGVVPAQSHDTKEGVVQAQSHDTKGGVVQAQSHDTKEGVVQAQSLDTKEGVVQAQSHDTKEGVVPAQSHDTKEGVVPAQSHDTKEGVVQAQSHDTKEGVVQAQSHDTKEGVVQAQSHDTKEGVVPAQSHDTKEGVVQAQSHDTKEGVVQAQSHDTKEGVVQAQSYDTKEGVVQAQSHDTKEGVVPAQSHDTKEGVVPAQSHDTKEGVVPAQSHDTKEGVVQAQSHDTKEGVVQAQSHDTKEGVVQAQSHDTKEGVVQAQSHDTKEGVVPAQSHDTKEGVVPAQSHDTKEGVVQAQSHDTKEGVVQAQSHDTKEGVVQAQSHDTKEGVVPAQSHDTKEGVVQAQSHDTKEGVVQAQSHDTKEGVVQAQSYDTKEGVVQAQSHDTKEGVVPAQSHDTKEGVVPAQSHDTKEGVVQAQSHDTKEGVVQAQSHDTKEGVVQAQSHDTKEGVVQAQSHDTKEGVVPAQSHDTKEGVVPAQSHDTKEGVVPAQSHDTKEGVVPAQSHDTKEGVVQAQSHDTKEGVVQAQSHDTKEGVVQAQSYDTKEGVVQAQSQELQLQDNPQTSEVPNHPGHAKPDDFENTKITFEMIGKLFKEKKINNAFCLISKYNNKFTKEELTAVTKTIKTFHNKVSNHSILILTCDNDHLEVGQEQQMFKEWYLEKIGTNRQLLDLCGKRYVLLNPWIEDEGAWTAQKERLVSLIQFVAGADTGNANENAEFDANNTIQSTESASPEALTFFQHPKSYIRTFFSELFS